VETDRSTGTEKSEGEMKREEQPRAKLEDEGGHTM
jgi:hypothetical protein